MIRRAFLQLPDLGYPTYLHPVRRIMSTLGSDPVAETLG